MSKTIENIPQNCPWCNKQFIKENSIIRHASKIHNKSRKEYDLLTKYNNIIPKCDCGCGEEVSYHLKKHKFNRFIKGHQCRNIEIKEKMIKGGRTAAQDQNVRKNHSTRAKVWWHDPNKKEMQDRVRDNWKQSMKDGHNKIKQTQEYRNKMSEMRTTYWKSPAGDEQRILCKSEEYRNNLSIATKKGFENNVEVHKFLSELASKNQALGIIGPNMTKRQWIFNEFTQQIEHFDSNWEVDILEIAIKRNIPIKRNKNIFINYIDINGKNRRYVPDFVTLSNQTLIEVKGLKTQNDLLKFEYANLYCSQHNMTFIVFDNKSIFNDDKLWSLIK